jgi:putative ABC transport system ATP-binding protein
MSIQLSNIVFSYQNTSRNPILNIENWAVERGDKYFIHGPSGSGKSTLLNIVSGLSQPNSGTVEVLGELLNKLSNRQRDKFRANNIGYIFQRFNLVNYLSAVENIKLAQYFCDRKQHKYLITSIYELLELLTVNSNDWHRPVDQLSVGQQQRIAIARAFINQPKLIIADEPTSSLDASARDNFMSLLSTLCNDTQATLLFVSHDTQLKSHFNKTKAFQDINSGSGNY